MRQIACLTLSACFAIPSVSAAQGVRLDVHWPTGEHNPSNAIVAADLDDDNDNGVPDAREASFAGDPARDDEVVTVSVAAPTGAVRVQTQGNLRLSTRAGLATEGLVPVGSNGRAAVQLVGIAPSRAASDSSVTFTAGGGSARVAVTVVGIGVLHGDNAVVWAHRDAVRISHEVTNSPTLPRAAVWGDSSPDAENLRLEVWDPGASRVGIARVEAVGTTVSSGVGNGVVRSAIGEMLLDRPADDAPLRSRFVRLVGDDTDMRAPGTQGQTLLVGLRDRVHVRYRRAGVAGEAFGDVRVGRPGNENGPLAARRARWHMVVMRDRQGGHPLIGGDDATAIRIAREQVSISNEIYLQCMITFGEPSTHPIILADPPQGSLISVGDDDGLAAAGGEIRFRVNGRPVGPVRVMRGWRPIETAEAIAGALRAYGFTTRTTLNRRTDYGADGSADVVARDSHGRLAEMTLLPGVAVTSDAQQSFAIGRVDFNDGLDEFNNLNSSSGTLEERTMLKSVTDDDPTTIDLFVINRFTHQTRIGEAFVEGDGGAVINALIMDRAGVAAQREAWTQSHEAGHIFLNQPWHPDNMGPDRPWLLMDADASLGAVTGPKRLEPGECRRITAESGVDAVPSLLSRYDEARPSPEAPAFANWPTEVLYPREGPAARPHVATAAAGARAADIPARTAGFRFE